MSSIHPKIRAFSVFIAGLLFIGVFLARIESSRAKPQDQDALKSVTVERLPASEARLMGVDQRNR